MTLDAIITAILKKLDELTPFNEGLVISTGNELLNPIKSYIDEFLQVSCDNVLRAAPYHTLPLTVIQTTSIQGNNAGVVTINLPAGFLRVGRIKFSSWQRPVFKTITTEDPEYNVQQNEFLRAGNAKPVVALVQKEGAKKIECYSVNSGEEAESANPELTCVISTTPEQMPDILVPALTWLVTSEVLKVIEKFKEAETALASYTSTLINL